MARKKSRQQENAIRKLRERAAVFWIAMGMVALVSALLLCTAEHPMHWTETEIVIRDISEVHQARGMYYRITDENNRTYSISGSNENAGQLMIGGSYQIVHASHYQNRIKSMTYGNKVIVDRGESELDYWAKAIIGWSGIAISGALVLISVEKLRRQVQKIRGRR